MIQADFENDIESTTDMPHEGYPLSSAPHEAKAKELEENAKERQTKRLAEKEERKKETLRRRLCPVYTAKLT